jgi:benzylsuccinate CoA-transferase BbsF subunit
MDLLQKNGIAAGVIQSTEDLMDKDHHLKEREFYQVREHPEMGTVTYDGVPFKFSETPGEIKRAPLMGEHNEYVYGKILGMPEEEINRYTVDGIFQ